MSSAVTQALSLTRELWPQKSIYEQLFAASPALGLARKETNFVEPVKHIYVGYAASQGVGSTYLGAKATKGASQQQRFDIVRGHIYGVVSIDGENIRAYEQSGNLAYIMDPVTRESKNMMDELKNRLSHQFYGNGVGYIGQMTAGSNPGTNTITLTNSADVRNFAPGMTLTTESTGATGGAIKGGSVVVQAILAADSAAPQIQVTSTSWTAGIPTAAASDFIYPGLDGYSAAAINGLESWLLDYSGSGQPGSFLGANRNLYPKKLAGNYLLGTTMSPKQRIQRSARIVYEAQREVPDTYLMSTRNFESLMNELTGPGMLRMTKVPAAPIGKISTGIQYDAVTVAVPGGEVQVFADPWMQDTIERCGKRDTMVLGSIGETVHWIQGADPGKPRMEDGADSYEMRAVGDIGFWIESPGSWCRVTVTAPT